MTSWIVAMVVAILLVVFATVALGIFLLSRWLGRMGEGMLAEHREELGEIVRSSTSANFIGLASKGSWQIRGNGALVLTPDRLWFRQLAGGGLEIALTDITGVEITRSHAGKTLLTPSMVRVRFARGDEVDSVAWAVADADGWLRSIDQARAGVDRR